MRPSAAKPASTAGHRRRGGASGSSFRRAATRARRLAALDPPLVISVPTAAMMAGNVSMCYRFRPARACSQRREWRRRREQRRRERRRRRARRRRAQRTSPTGDGRRRTRLGPSLRRSGHHRHPGQECRLEPGARRPAAGDALPTHHGAVRGGNDRQFGPCRRSTAVVPRGHRLCGAPARPGDADAHLAGRDPRPSSRGRCWCCWPAGSRRASATAWSSSCASACSPTSNGCRSPSSFERRPARSCPA